MELDEAITGIVAQVIEEVVGILAGGVRADERRAAIVESVGLMAFSQIAIIESSELTPPSLAKAASSMTTRW
jgi:hypothetical protein